MSFYTNMSFEVVELPACGHTFALRAADERQLRESHRTFYCPICGAKLHWPQLSDKEKLERQVKLLTQERDRARGRAKHERASKNAVKGHLTRTKNRVANGVCPCCNRTFKDLARHMAGQHPDYAHAED